MELGKKKTYQKGEYPSDRENWNTEVSILGERISHFQVHFYKEHHRGTEDQDGR